MVNREIAWALMG